MSVVVRPAALPRAALTLAALALAALAGCSSGSTSGSTSGSASASASASAASSAAVGPAATATSGPLAGLDPAKVLAKAQAALAGARSVHLMASGPGQDGSQNGFDVHAAAGGDATGDLYFGGDNLALVRQGGTVYLKGHQDLLSQLVPSGTDLAGKWVKVPAGRPEIASVLAIASLRTGMGGILLPKGALSFGPSKVVDGHPTVAVVEAAATPVTVYVAADGTPYPLLLESQVGGPAGTRAHFTEWDAPFPVTPPPAAGVVTASR